MFKSYFDAELLKHFSKSFVKCTNFFILPIKFFGYELFKGYAILFVIWLPKLRNNISPGTFQLSTQFVYIINEIQGKRHALTESVATFFSPKIK